MDLAAIRERVREQERIRSLIDLVPNKGESALDAGARDGYLSVALASHFDCVTALDLEKPTIRHEKVLSVKGDITSLDFQSNTFNLVLCAEVLEHIPSSLLGQACSELERVTGNFLIIGVPYKQDIRVGRAAHATLVEKRIRHGAM